MLVSVILNVTMDGCSDILNIELEANPIVIDRRSVLKLLECVITPEIYSLWSTKEPAFKSIKIVASSIVVAVWHTESNPPHLDVVVLIKPNQVDRYAFCPHQVSFMRKQYKITSSLNACAAFSKIDSPFSKDQCWQQHLIDFGSGIIFGMPPSEVMSMMKT